MLIFKNVGRLVSGGFLAYHVQVRFSFNKRTRFWNKKYLAEGHAIRVPLPHIATVSHGRIPNSQAVCPVNCWNQQKITTLAFNRYLQQP